MQTNIKCQNLDQRVPVARTEEKWGKDCFGVIEIFCILIVVLVIWEYTCIKLLKLHT